MNVPNKRERKVRPHSSWRDVAGGLLAGIWLDRVWFCQGLT